MFKASQSKAMLDLSKRPAYLQRASEDMVHLRDVPGYFDPITERTLVLYVFASNDVTYIENLRFFIEAAVHANDPVDYVFIIQQDQQDASKRTPLDQLPHLPPNARYVEHENECFDWGAWAWILNLPKEHPSAIKDLSIYKYFILMNSSIRGPFLPAWVETVFPFSSDLYSWASIFTSQLRKYAASGLKFVGVSLSCNMKAAHMDHVQSYLVATDLEGLQILREKSTSLRCHKDFKHAVDEGEIAASQSFVKQGFNLGVIASYGELLDYRLHDHCARHGDVLVAGADGIKLDPFDLVFTKYRTSLRWYDSKEAFERAKVYDTWWRDRKKRREQWEIEGTFSKD